MKELDQFTRQQGENGTECADKLQHMVMYIKIGNTECIDN